MGPIREKLSRARLEDGKTVEIPYSVNWFHETHNIEVKSYDIRISTEAVGRIKKLCRIQTFSHSGIPVTSVNILYHRILLQYCAYRETNLLNNLKVSNIF
jgi:hypothetical protein